MRLRFCPVPQVDEVDAESECRATGGGGCDRQDRLRPRTTRSREPPVSCEQTEHRPTTPARSSRTTPPIGTSMPSSPRRRNTPPPLHQASRVVPASCSPGPGARRQLHVQPWAADGSRRHASFGRLRRADGVAEVEGCVRVDAQSALVKRHALLLQRVKNLSFRGCIHGLMGDLLGRRYRRTRRAAASRGGLSVYRGTMRETRLPAPRHLQFIPHRGLAASPGSCRIIAGRSQNRRRRES
jgi:hypothetical protein